MRLLLPLRASRVLLLALTPLAATACKRGGAVEGDLSLSNGQKGAYLKVSLLRDAGSALTAAIDTLCKAEQADVRRSQADIQRMDETAQRYRQTKGRTSAAQVALSDSLTKYRQAASDARRALNNRPDTTYQKIMALVQAAVDTQAESDAEGHFRFAKRPPGQYVLFAEWLGPRGDEQFFAPVELTDGDTKTQNLDKSTASSRLRCQ